MLAYTLAILACLQGAPDTCRIYELPIALDARWCSPMVAQTKVTSWATQHPGLMVRRWRCREGQGA